MKKWLLRSVVLLLAAAILLMSCACGKKDTETESGEVVGAPESGKTYEPKDGRLFYLSNDLSEYVSLASFSGLSVTVDMKAVDENVEKSLRELSKSYATVSTGKTVAEGDVVLCNFTGYVDGKKFTSATNEQIDVSKNGYEKIPGLAEGLVGAVPGNTWRVNVTLPSDYSESEYAGKQATIEVAVGYVITPSLTNENVQDYTSGKYKSISEYKKYLREENYRSSAVQSLIGKIREQATFKETFDAALEQCYRDLVQMITSNTDMTYEEYLKANGFTDADIRGMAKDSYEYNLVMYRLVQITGIQVYEGDYYPKFEEFVKEYQSQREAAGDSVSREDAEKYINENRELVISSCLETKVFDYLLANNKVEKK